MKLAVTYHSDNGQVFRQFEKTKVLKLYEIENGEVVHTELVGTMAESVSDIVGLIGMMEADGVLCGDLLPETITLLNEEGILFYSGFYEDADEAVQDFIDGYILFGPDEIIPSGEEASPDTDQK